MKKAKQYEIETLEQLYNIATPENQLRLLTDFGAYLMMYVNFTEKIREGLPETSKGKKNTELFSSKFLWTDDGIKGVTAVRLTTQETGETVIIKMKKK